THHRATGTCANILCKSKRAGLRYVTHSESVKEVAFLLAAGGGVNLRAQLTGDLNGREPYTSRGGMDEDALAGTQPSQFIKGIAGGRECAENSRPLLEGQVVRLWEHEAAVHQRVGCKHPRTGGNNRLSERQPSHSLTQGCYGSRAFNAELATGVATLECGRRQISQRHHEILEVKASGAYLNFDLAGLRTGALRRPHAQTLE